jgi:EGF-like domain
MVVSPEGKGCVDRNECLDMPCLNGGTCINQEPRLRYRCICPENFWGDNCMFMKERQALKLSTSAFAAVIGCLLIIISELRIESALRNENLFQFIFPQFCCFCIFRSTVRNRQTSRSPSQRMILERTSLITVMRVEAKTM